MLELVLALALCAGIGLALRGGWVGKGRGLALVGFDPQALGMGVLAVLAAAYFLGPQFGAALIIMVVIHEFGHVAAYRVCGHSDARFRLIPLFGGVAISSRPPATQINDIFITLMGPAICLGPMVLSLALSQLVLDHSIAVANFLYVLALVLGGVNFFNLLPIYPLDGGKIVQLLVFRANPAWVRPVSIGMGLVAVAVALLTRSYLLLFFIVISWQGLMSSGLRLSVQKPMSAKAAWLSLAAYLATALAFLVVGWPMVQRFL